MKLDDYIAALEEEIGTIVIVKEYYPGLFYLEASQEDRFSYEYYALLDDSPLPFTAQVQSYGQRMDGLRLYAADKPGSGWDVVQYEVSKYGLVTGRECIPEELFQDASLHAMESYPEYFGTFPVPYHTPGGYTLRWRALANGVYWLETSQCKELLALCFPVWNAELSAAAAALAQAAEWDRITGVEKAMGYAFFPKEASCVPIYELMLARKEWEGTVIHTPALMNALWAYAPEYAMRLNVGKSRALDGGHLQAPETAPQTDGKHVAGMFPGEGTDFLLLK